MLRNILSHSNIIFAVSLCMYPLSYILGCGSLSSGSPCSSPGSLREGAAGYSPSLSGHGLRGDLRNSSVSSGIHSTGTDFI